jgi:hypothetical protein
LRSTYYKNSSEQVEVLDYDVMQCVYALEKAFPQSQLTHGSDVVARAAASTTPKQRRQPAGRLPRGGDGQPGVAGPGLRQVLHGTQAATAPTWTSFGSHLWHLPSQEYILRCSWIERNGTPEVCSKTKLSSAFVDPFGWCPCADLGRRAPLPRVLRN